MGIECKKGPNVAHSGDFRQMIPRKHRRKHGFCLVLPSKFMGSCESLPVSMRMKVAGSGSTRGTQMVLEFCCCTSLDDESREHVAIEILIRAKQNNVSDWFILVGYPPGIKHGWEIHELNGHLDTNHPKKMLDVPCPSLIRG